MTTTKRIIQRNLPLNQRYALISTNYVPLVDGIGMCCDNCNKLIANMANVKAESGKHYTIGLDCLETFLINNALLDNKSVEHYNQIVKKSLPKIRDIREQVKEFLNANTFIDSVKVEVQFNKYLNWIVINYYHNGRQRWNDGMKFKTMDADMLKASLESIRTNAKFEIISTN